VNNGWNLERLLGELAINDIKNGRKEGRKPARSNRQISEFLDELN